ncbi:MAG: FkbM family methyltransferase, partial [Bacteroidota bacterium]
IGANIGQTALEFAKLSGKGSIVLAFEPHPGNFAAAKTNMALNDFSNIKLLNIGLGSNKTKLPITTCDHNSGSNKIASESNSNTTVVDIEKLDDILEIKNLTKVDLIKIDVEGFEMEVLKGAELTIRKFNPILFIELDDNNLKNQKSSANELVIFLKNLNFLIMDSETEQVISETTNFENCHFDIICKPLAVQDSI